MIQLLIQPIREVMENTSYVHRYGGLAIPVTTKIKTGDPDNPVYVAKTFPIAEDVYGKECWEEGREQDLVPSENYNSIFWLEETAAPTFEANTSLPGRSRAYQVLKNGQSKIVTAGVRMIGFINRKRLEVDHLYVPGDLLLKLDIETEIAGQIPVKNLKIKPVGMEPKGPGIFSKYTFEEMENYLLYPFDYFAINLQITGLVSAGCVDLLTKSPELC